MTTLSDLGIVPIVTCVIESGAIRNLKLGELIDGVATTNDVKAVPEEMKSSSQKVGYNTCPPVI